MASPRPLPVVLTGGKSRRYGRDKLREASGGGMLVDIPIRALRDVFGSPVAGAGECHPSVAARFDLVIRDRAGDCGPIGGIVSALEHALGRHGIFVLAGDLPRIEGTDVRTVWDAAEIDPGSWAVLADSGRLEPCVGIYRAAALPILVEWMSRDRRSLHDALPEERIRRVPIAPGHVMNVNAPRDWDAAR